MWIGKYGKNKENMNVCYVLAVLRPLGIERNFSSLSIEAKWKSFGFYQERFWFLPRATVLQSCSLDKETKNSFSFCAILLLSLTKFLLYLENFPFVFFSLLANFSWLNPKSILIGANIKKGRESKNFSRARKNIFLI